MGRLPKSFLLSLLAFTSAAASTAQQAGPKGSRHILHDNRVIVRFAAGVEHGETELLQTKVRELAVRPGVLKAKALEHVGMAIITCDSLESEEELVRELEEDPHVELATPDTWVQFDGALQGSGGRKGQEWPFQDMRQCSAQSGCAALGLMGQCCPAADGLMLACCDAQFMQNQATFKSFHGKYVVAEADGTINANRAKADDWERFQVVKNDDGTISLRTYFGKYVGADSSGVVTAQNHLTGNPEKFNLINNEDGTVALKSFHGKYVAAELDGRLVANRDSIGDWEKFDMHKIGSSNQRFPNDVNFTDLWGMHELEDQDIDAPEAWQKFTGEFSAGIVVAVIDTGIDYTHEDLRDNMWVNPGEIPGNGLDDDGNGFVDDIHGADFANGDGDPMDDQLHGTHCAGTIAGVGNNGIGVTGVAWHGVKLMALKFLSATGGGKTSDAVEAVNYAVAHGAKISSNSWGGGGSNAALRVAIEQAKAAGMLFIAAAGNSGSNNDEDPHYPSNYASDNIVSVASTTASGELSGFSCFGATTVDVAAPGSRIYSTVPNQGYKFLSGTSMATPHVSGLAALIWMYRPSLSMMQVKEILMNSVERYQALEGKVLTNGRINANKALELASAFEPPYPPLHAPTAVMFEDTDPKVGLIAGTVTIAAATDESDVDYYKVYFVSRAGYQLDAVGSVNATGTRFLRLAISPRSIPQYGVGLVAVTGNATGEMPAQIGGSAPNVTVEDFVMPESGPQDVSWGGDVDLHHGLVAGKLLVTRAVDEASISQYNIYWSNASGVRGPKLGSIPSIGFRMPKCTGPACSQINVTTVEGGHSFNRGNYSDGETATIVASGPAIVRLTRFDTESYYDTLTIGSEEISGQPSVPQELEVPEGPLSITWLSDDSVTATGWSFDLLQTGVTAEFMISATVPLGRGLEVVPAYGTTELAEGVFVEVVDFDDTMPPSPGLAPASIHFVDTDNATGIIAGIAAVVPVPRDQHSLQAANRGVGEAKLKAARPDDLLEPWLQPPSVPEERDVVWPAGVDTLLSASRVAHSHISCAVTLPGLDASTIVGLPAREAFKDAIHAELPFAGPESVTVTKILSISSPAAVAEPDSLKGKKAIATTVQFRVEPSRDAPPHAVDRIEARLILLSLGGRRAESFNRDLVGRLAAAGAHLPAGTRSQVQQPQHVTHKRSGRALSGVAAVVVAEEPADASLSSPQDEDVQAPLFAGVVAALCAMLALVAALVLTRRRRKEECAVSSGALIQPTIDEAITIDQAPPS